MSNWFEEEERSPLMPEGIHQVILTNVTLDETRMEPRVSVEFTHQNNRKSWLNLTFAETRKKFVNWQLKELGVFDRVKAIAIAQSFTPARAAMTAIGELIGAQCEICVEHNEWQGKTYANVRVESCGVAAQPVAQEPKKIVRSPLKNHAPVAQAKTQAPPSFNQNDELPDFMR